MAGKYYVGIVLESCGNRIKVLRKTRIYQFICDEPVKAYPGDWINFSASLFFLIVYNLTPETKSHTLTEAMTVLMPCIISQIETLDSFIS